MVVIDFSFGVACPEFVVVWWFVAEGNFLSNVLFCLVGSFFSRLLFFAANNCNLVETALRLAEMKSNSKIGLFVQTKR